MHLVENPKGAKGLTVKNKSVSTLILQPTSKDPSKLFYANTSVHAYTLRIWQHLIHSILHLAIFSLNNVS